MHSIPWSNELVCVYSPVVLVLFFCHILLYGGMHAGGSIPFVLPCMTCMFMYMDKDSEWNSFLKVCSSAIAAWVFC